MGEEPWRIHTVGDNHIDPIVSGEHADPQAVAAHLDLNLDEPIAIVLQHSETTAPNDAYKQMVETLAPVAESGIQAVVVHPCSDPGYDGILRAIDELARSPQFRVRVNIDAYYFWGLMAVATVIVGNSSAGLVECPSLRLPAINVGRRQEGRLHAENVIHGAHDRAEIAAALHELRHDPDLKAWVANCSQPFGDRTGGGAARQGA